MAYTRATTQSCPAPCDPGVLTVLVNTVAAASANDRIIKIPWNNCKLVYGYTVVTTKVNSKATLNVDLERTAAGGTLLGTATQAKSAAVGTVVEFTMATVTTSVTEDHFKFDDSGLLNLEVTGASSAAGQVLVYLFFEPTIY